MPMLRYQELNLLQMLDVLRGASLAHLALSDGGRPYVVPMAYQLEARGSEVMLHLVSPEAGRKIATLRRNDRVCLEIDLPACAWMDTVLAEGRATAGMAEPGRAVEVVVSVMHMSGRRYFVQMT